MWCVVCGVVWCVVLCVVMVGLEDVCGCVGGREGEEG